MIVLRPVVEGKLRANAMERITAGPQLSTLRFFEPAKLLDDGADYCRAEVSPPVQAPGIRFYS